MISILVLVAIENLIGDLSSADGTKRIAASAEIFRRGKDVLPDLKKAGAKQGGLIIQPARIRAWET